MSEIPGPNPDLSDSYEVNKKQELEGMADQMRDELVRALALLDDAKSKMTGGDLDAAWKIMDEVHGAALRVSINSDRLRIRLRQEAEYKIKLPKKT